MFTNIPVSEVSDENGMFSSLIVSNHTGFLSSIPVVNDEVTLSFDDFMEAIRAWNESQVVHYVQHAEVNSGIELGIDNLLFVVAPNPKPFVLGKVRVTTYRNGPIYGPCGEAVYESFSHAILDVMQCNRHLAHRQGCLDAWMEEPRFIRGFEIVDLIARYNDGLVSVREFRLEMERLAA